MKPKRTRSSYVLLVGLMSLLIVGGWLAYQIYAGLTKTQISERQQTAIAPLDGTIRPEVINNLKGRRKFSPADFSQLVFNIVISTASASP